GEGRLPDEVGGRLEVHVGVAEGAAVAGVGAVVGAASELDEAPPAEAEAVAGLVVAEVGAALVAALRVGRPPQLLREPEASALVGHLREEVRTAKRCRDGVRLHGRVEAVEVAPRVRLVPLADDLEELDERDALGRLDPLLGVVLEVAEPADERGPDDAVVVEPVAALEHAHDGGAVVAVPAVHLHGELADVVEELLELRDEGAEVLVLAGEAVAQLEHGEGHRHRRERLRRGRSPWWGPPQRYGGTPPRGKPRSLSRGAE